MHTTGKRLTLLALALLPGCTVPFHARRSVAYELANEEPVTLEVTNDLLSEAKVYLERSAERRKLGSVPAGQTVRFTVPGRIICGFDAHLSISSQDGLGEFSSDEFVARPGEVLTFKLRQNGAYRFPDR